MKSTENLLTDYDIQLFQYKSFEIKMNHLISDLLDSKNLNVHNISSRVKQRESLEKKLIKKNKYSNLNEVTDMVGIRIVTYFEDEVDVVANLIAEEFKIDIPNSTDKRVIEYDRFGYASFHYVASLNVERGNLSEYKIFQNHKFEIQIRSILQHAWAEIEHDIGYKSKASIPDIAKRNFSRVAALLETADLEFTKLRTRLLEYEKDVEFEISNDPANVDLNDISLQSFAQNNEIIYEMDKSISEKSKVILHEDFEIDGYSPKLQYLGIKNIQQLAKVLEEKRDKIETLAIKFLNRNNGNEPNDHFDDEDNGFITSGISIFYLCYLIVAEKGLQEVRNFVDKFFDIEYSEDLPLEIMETFNKIK